jgi:hypothetical protein
LRYVEIVRSDVLHKTPDWYKEHKTFDQIFSGGGACGPRAWAGRFICKAFGIPTFGVKQPGHAVSLYCSTAKPHKKSTLTSPLIIFLYTTTKTGHVAMDQKWLDNMPGWRF